MQQCQKWTAFLLMVIFALLCVLTLPMETAKAYTYQYVSPTSVEEMVALGEAAKKTGKPSSYFDKKSGGSHCGWFAYNYCINQSSLANEGVTIPDASTGAHYGGVRYLLQRNYGTVYICCSDYHAGEEETYRDKWTPYSGDGGANVVITDKAHFTPQRGDLALMGFSHNVSGHVAIMTSSSACVYASGDTLYANSMNGSDSWTYAFDDGVGRYYGQGVYGYFRFNTAEPTLEVDFAYIWSNTNLAAEKPSFGYWLISQRNGVNVAPSEIHAEVFDANGNYLFSVTSVVNLENSNGQDYYHDDGSNTALDPYDNPLKDHTEYQFRIVATVEGTQYASYMSSFSTYARLLSFWTSASYKNGDTFVIVENPNMHFLYNMQMNIQDLEAGVLIFDENDNEIAKMVLPCKSSLIGTYEQSFNAMDNSYSYFFTSDYGVQLEADTTYKMQPYCKLNGKLREDFSGTYFYGDKTEIKTHPAFTLPAGTKTIEREAFRGCGASFIRVPDGATSIGIGAFYECPNLKMVYIPPSVTSIDQILADSYTFLIVGVEESYVQTWLRTKAVDLHNAYWSSNPF